MPTPSRSRPCFYAVRAGRQPGIYTSYDQCKAQTEGYPRAEHKKFSTEHEAHAYVSREPEDAQTDPSSALARAPTPPAAPTVASTLVDASLPGTSTVAYVQGVCSDHHIRTLPRSAGVGVWFGDGDDRNVSESCPGDADTTQTNNRAALIAVIRAIEQGGRSTSPLTIYTSAEYVKTCMKYYEKWVQNGWKTTKNKAPENSDIVKYLYRLKQLKGCQIESIVAGTRHPGLEKARILARSGQSAGATLLDRDWAGLTHGLELEFISPDDLAVVTLLNGLRI